MKPNRCNERHLKTKLSVAVCFAIHCFADGTNGVSGENQEKKIIAEDGPLKDLAAAVLNTGIEEKLDSVVILKSAKYTNTIKFPPAAAMQFGFVSNNNEVFVVNGLDSELFDSRYPGYPPWAFAMVRVSQQRGKTDIIFARESYDIGVRTFYYLYSTSPSGVLEKVFCWNGGIYMTLPPDQMKWAEADFQKQIGFWSDKLGISNKKPDEPKK